MMARNTGTSFISMKKS